MDIGSIQAAVQQNGIFFTEHAVRQMVKRSIMDTEVQGALSSGEIIEEYPADKYGPSCLILGNSEQKRPLHMVCSLPPRIRIVTVYEPDPEKWIDNRHRRETHE